jgi:hypothetical protein
MRACPCAVLFALVSGLILGQTKPKEEFEAASVKPVPEGYLVQCEVGPNRFPCSNLGPRAVDGRRFRAMTDVSSLIQWAYGVREFCVFGVPERLRVHPF